MMTMRTIAASLTLALAPLPTLEAQDPATVAPPGGTITGVVHAPDGMPLAGVEIVIDDLRRRTRSDAAGKWSFEAVPAGTYHLIARRVGFVPVKRTIRLPERARARVVDTLTYTGVRLDPSVVSARRQQFPGTLERVERGASVVSFAEDIAAIPTNLYDIDALLARSLPLRSRLSFGGRRPFCGYVEGGAPVLVDGHRVPASIPLREWVRPYEIELFEISRGPVVVQDETRRRLAGDTIGPRIDPRIGGCEWVWLIWTKEYMRSRNSDS